MPKLVDQYDAGLLQKSMVVQSREDRHLVSDVTARRGKRGPRLLLPLFSLVCFCLFGLSVRSGQDNVLLLCLSLGAALVATERRLKQR